VFNITIIEYLLAELTVKMADAEAETAQIFSLIFPQFFQNPASQVWDFYD